MKQSPPSSSIFWGGGGGGGKEERIPEVSEKKPFRILCSQRWMRSEKKRFFLSLFFWSNHKRTKLAPLHKRKRANSILEVFFVPLPYQHAARKIKHVVTRLAGHAMFSPCAALISYNVCWSGSSPPSFFSRNFAFRPNNFGAIHNIWRKKSFSDTTSSTVNSNLV